MTVNLLPRAHEIITESLFKHPVAFINALFPAESQLEYCKTLNCRNPYNEARDARTARAANPILLCLTSVGGFVPRRNALNLRHE